MSRIERVLVWLAAFFLFCCYVFLVVYPASQAASPPDKATSWVRSVTGNADVGFKLHWNSGFTQHTGPLRRQLRACREIYDHMPVEKMRCVTTFNVEFGDFAVLKRSLNHAGR